MNKVWELLQEPDIVVLFDVDGTLTSYNYGEYHAHHELDFTPEFRDVNIYADCKRLMPMYNYIQSMGLTEFSAFQKNLTDTNRGNRKCSKGCTEFQKTTVIIHLNMTRNLLLQSE